MTTRRCVRCEGRGTVIREYSKTKWQFRVTCPACKGSGQR